MVVSEEDSSVVSSDVDSESDIFSSEGTFPPAAYSSAGTSAVAHEDNATHNTSEQTISTRRLNIITPKNALVLL